ncbi:MAG: glycoside hydrolase family 28 protein [Clostridia bacterium]|nr:glycoside hydrolase family 28 protein [Clostridia bacterium]
MADWNIHDFGAVADASTNAGPAIQAAVDAAHAAGGGRVIIPAGTFLSGSVLLKSRVELHLVNGALLLSSLDPAEIAAFPHGADEGGVDGWNGGFFLGARDAENVVISGDGVIDGRGREVFSDADCDAGFHECPKRCASFRPRLSLFENVTNLTIRDVTLKDAAFWTLHMAGCRHVRISGIRIQGDDRGANNDGIDPDCCQDVNISGCSVFTGDDAIVVKSTGPMAARYGVSEDIVICGCVLHSRDSALKIGTETHGVIRRVSLSDCMVQDCSRAVGIWVRDGGTVEDIHVHHLTGTVRRWGDAYDSPGAPGWWGKGEPVFISATRRPQKPDSFPGVIRRVSFDHLYLTCESSLFLGGETYSPIEDVRMSEIHLRFERTGTQPGGLFDEQPSARHKYPHAIPALYARSVRGLRLKDSTVRFVGEGEAWDGTLTELEDCDGSQVCWEEMA